MKPKNGISRQGNASEKKFHNLTKIPKSSIAKKGDFEYNNVFIEVKKVTINAKGSGTINQVRAVKNCVLVVHIKDRGMWFILDSKQVSKMITKLKSRGQHCENPYESATLSIKNLNDFGHQSVSDAALKGAVIDAVKRTKLEKELREISEKMVDELQLLSRKYKKKIEKIVE